MFGRSLEEEVVNSWGRWGVVILLLRDFWTTTEQRSHPVWDRGGRKLPTTQKPGKKYGEKNVRPFVPVICVEPFSGRRKRPFWKIPSTFPSSPIHADRALHYLKARVVEDVVRMIKSVILFQGYDS